MNILSLFDGISVARVSLERAGIPVSKYYASEIDKYAISVSKKNYPDIEHLGDIRGISGYNLPKINIIIGGSPCTDLSIAKKNREGLAGKQSGLFWEYVRLKEMLKPDYFILENVASMPASARQTITNALGVEPIMINAALVSAQNRKRLFFTNIKGITQPTDRGVCLIDVVENPPNIDGKKTNAMKKLYEIHKGQGGRVYSLLGKSSTLSANGGGAGAKTGLYDFSENTYRKLLPTECETLQGLPRGYTEGISNSQRYKVLGNAFNADVVSHILSFIPKEKL